MSIKLGEGHGARLSEILGLKWADVDFEGRFLTIRRTLHWTREPGKKTWYFDKPKTKSSYRTIKLCNSDVEVLKLFYAKQQMEKQLLGQDYQDHDLVCAHHDGSPYNSTSVSSCFRTIVKRHGYSIRFHDLRHSHATILLMEKNFPVKKVSDRLGHSSTAFTMDIYVHALPDSQDDISEAMEEILGNEDVIDVTPDIAPDVTLLPGNEVDII